MPAPPRVRTNVRPLSQTMSTATATTPALPPPVNVKESKAKCQQRLRSRFRDVEGKHLSTPISYPVHLTMGNRIFVPPEKNTLVDLLLARSVTGEFPNKSATSSIPTTKERQPPSPPVHTVKKPLKRKAKTENKVENRGDEAGRSNCGPSHPIY